MTVPSRSRLPEPLLHRRRGRTVRVAAAVLACTASAAGFTPTPAMTSAADPIGMTSGFYVNTASSPATWVRNNSGDPRAARIQTAMGSRPIARWFGNEGGNIAGAVAGYVGVADSHDKLPVLVAYNIPGRDACGGHSGGGAGGVGAAPGSRRLPRR